MLFLLKICPFIDVKEKEQEKETPMCTSEKVKQSSHTCSSWSLAKWNMSYLKEVTSAACNLRTLNWACSADVQIILFFVSAGERGRDAFLMSSVSLLNFPLNNLRIEPGVTNGAWERGQFILSVIAGSMLRVAKAKHTTFGLTTQAYFAARFINFLSNW